MLKRTVVGLVLVGVILFFLFYLRIFSEYYVDILILGYMLPGAYEMVRCFKNKGYHVILIPIIFAAFCVYPIMVGFQYAKISMEVGMIVTLIVATLLSMIIFTFKHKFTINDLFATFFILVYPIMLFSLLFIINHGLGQLLALCLIIGYSVFTDTFAYLFGVTIKGPKLCPSISPKKTIAGFIGGLFGGILTSILVFIKFDLYDVYSYMGNAGRTYLLPDKTTSICFYIFFGIVCALLAMLGDLSASWIKRKLEIKDFGHIFPGHGGIMDRIDSFLFIIPTIYILFKILVTVEGAST